MTIKDLIEFAKEQFGEDYENVTLEVQYRDDGGYYSGTDDELVLEVNQENQIITL